MRIQSIGCASFSDRLKFQFWVRIYVRSIGWAPVPEFCQPTLKRSALLRFAIFRYRHTRLFILITSSDKIGPPTKRWTRTSSGEMGKHAWASDKIWDIMYKLAHECLHLFSRPSFDSHAMIGQNITETHTPDIIGISWEVKSICIPMCISKQSNHIWNPVGTRDLFYDAIRRRYMRIIGLLKA